MFNGVFLVFILTSCELSKTSQIGYSGVITDETIISAFGFIIQSVHQ